MSEGGTGPLRRVRPGNSRTSADTCVVGRGAVFRVLCPGVKGSGGGRLKCKVRGTAGCRALTPGSSHTSGNTCPAFGGLGVWVLTWEFRMQGAGCRAQGAGRSVQGAGCRVQGAGCCWI